MARQNKQALGGGGASMMTLPEMASEVWRGRWQYENNATDKGPPQMLVLDNLQMCQTT